MIFFKNFKKLSNCDIYIAIILVCSGFYLNIKWMSANRYGLGLDIDEAGYIAQSISFARSLIGGGVLEWLRAIDLPSPNAPFLPVLSSIGMYFFGISENIALGANSLINAILCLVIFFIVRRLVKGYASIISVILVYSIPIVIDYSRSYQFALPASLFYMLAILSYIYSERFSSKKWSVAVGFSLASMIMSRTMTIAFLPAFALCFLVDGFLLQKKRNTSYWLNIAIAILAFILFSSLWYISHFRYVFEYLFSFGYGSHASEYGKTAGFFSIDNIKYRIDLVFQEIGFINFIICVPVFIYFLLYQVYFYIKYRTIKSDNSYIVAVGILTIISNFTLWTSKNIGGGFQAPILISLVFIAVIAILKPSKFIFFRYLLILILLINSVFICTLKYYTHLCSNPIAISLSGLRSDYCGSIYGRYKQFLYTDYGKRIDDIKNQDLNKFSENWVELNSKMVEWVHLQPNLKGLVVFASRHMFLNVNTFTLAEIENFGTIYPKSQIDPSQMSNNLTSTIEWLNSPQISNACTIVVLSNNLGEFSPKIDTHILEQGFKEKNYHIIKTFPTPMPDQNISIWQGSNENCK